MPKLKNLKQEKFCQLYIGKEGAEFFGSGVKAYAKAYGLKLTGFGVYDTCKVNASKLLTNTNICDRITELIDLAGFNDQNADRHLLFLMSQYDDRRSKLSAIREYNALKQRIVQKIENTHKIETLESIESTLKSIGSPSNSGTD